MGARQKIFGSVNYIERLHDIADVPFVPNPKFYATDGEIAIAKAERAKIAAPVIIWCLTGTSHHKTYPYLNVALKYIIEQTPAHVYLYGDKHIAKMLQDAIVATLEEDKVDLSRVHARCGDWDIRASLAFAQQADIVIGPETGVMNAVSHEEKVHKIIYLSHSSHTNLTRDWSNTAVLTPKNTKCYPCHLLHYNWDNCVKIESTAAAMCATDIKPEEIFKATMDELLRKAKTLDEAAE